MCALAVLGSFAPAAAADGGAAACSTPVTVNRAQQLDGLALEPGPYTVTILDSSELSCDEAIEEFRSLLRAPGAELPEGWEVEPGTRIFERSDGTAASSSRTTPRPTGAAGSAGTRFRTG